MQQQVEPLNRMQFACLTQIVVRFALVHFVCNIPFLVPFASTCNEVYLLTIVCFGPEGRRQVTGRTVVQDNNEALLSLSLSSSISLFAFACRLSPFAFVCHQLHCIFYLTLYPIVAPFSIYIRIFV